MGRAALAAPELRFLARKTNGGKEMVRLQIGSFGKILIWLFVLGTAVAGFSEPFWFAVSALFFILGPCIAIPAMIAVHGKTVLSSQTPAEIRETVDSVFGKNKTGRKWIAQKDGLGALNYELISAKGGCEPTVSVDFENSSSGLVIVHVWMSEWTSGGLNGGKGTPFWTWGGARALSQVNAVARLVE
ncbi:MAG: hypothetical protein LBS27_04365 [Bifidobacteriaceae bacterium]|nr:hypothetical protein [Bifidobacteriaceae bacterium]